MENHNSFNSESNYASKIPHSKINTSEETFLELKQKKSSRSSSERSNNNDIENSSDFEDDNDLDHHDENINKK